MQRIVVDYNDYSQIDGEYRVRVGFADQWQLIGTELREGAPALFVQRPDLEMQGVLRRELIHGKEYWYGVVDTSTQRDFVAARLSADTDRAEVLETLVFFQDGDAVVFYDDDHEVYGTIFQVSDADGSSHWQGIVDWSTQRTYTDLPSAAWAEQRRLVEAQRRQTSAQQDNSTSGDTNG
jgi:hypothetical protein